MNTPIFRKITIQTYKPGRSFLSKKKKIIKLSANESALGMSNDAKKVIKKFNDNISKYPDGKFRDLTSIISKKYNCNQNQVICGSGSDEIIQMLCQLFLNKGDQVIVPEFSFLMYRIYAQIVGAKVVFSKEKNFKVSNNEILKKISNKTKIVFLANPNNPTGTYLTRNQIIDILDKLPKSIILVLDGAYAEYVTKEDYDSSFSLVDQFENVIITRTFSKAYGLAGIRLGWCYSSEKVASILNKVKGPFNTQSLSQEMAIIALDDKEYLSKVIKSNRDTKSWFESELEKIKIKTRPSEGNFSFVEMSDEEAKKIFAHLANSGIIVRQLDSYGLPNCLRITIGTREEMEATINSLKGL